MSAAVLPALGLPCPCVSGQKNAEQSRVCVSSPFARGTKAPKRSKCVVTNTSVCSVCALGVDGIKLGQLHPGAVGSCSISKTCESGSDAFQHHSGASSDEPEFFTWQWQSSGSPLFAFQSALPLSKMLFPSGKSGIILCLCSSNCSPGAVLFYMCHPGFPSTRKCSGGSWEFRG